MFADDRMFYLWINLLMRANWKDGKFWPRGASVPFEVGRGQLVTGRNALRAMLYPERDLGGHLIERECLPPHSTTLWRWLVALKNDGMVALDVRSKYTIVTICNYDTYQNCEGDDAQDDAQVTRKWCASDAQVVRTIEEIQEGKKVKKERARTAAFVAPTVDDVAAYCAERKNGLDAAQFVDHYTANGWVQGRGKPIRDWKAAVRTWERNGVRSPAVASTSPRPLTQAELDEWCPGDAGGGA